MFPTRNILYTILNFLNFLAKSAQIRQETKVTIKINKKSLIETLFQKN